MTKLSIGLVTSPGEESEQLAALLQSFGLQLKYTIAPQAITSEQIEDGELNIWLLNIDDDHWHDNIDQLLDESDASIYFNEPGTLAKQSHPDYWCQKLIDRLYELSGIEKDEVEKEEVQKDKVEVETGGPSNEVSPTVEQKQPLSAQPIENVKNDSDDIRKNGEQLTSALAQLETSSVGLPSDIASELVSELEELGPDLESGITLDLEDRKTKQLEPIAEQELTIDESILSSPDAHANLELSSKIDPPEENSGLIAKDSDQAGTTFSEISVESLELETSGNSLDDFGEIDFSLDSDEINLDEMAQEESESAGNFAEQSQQLFDEVALPDTESAVSESSTTAPSDPSDLSAFDDIDFSNSKIPVLESMREETTELSSKYQLDDSDDSIEDSSANTSSDDNSNSLLDCSEDSMEIDAQVNIVEDIHDFDLIDEPEMSIESANTTQAEMSFESEQLSLDSEGATTQDESIEIVESAEIGNQLDIDSFDFELESQTETQDEIITGKAVFDTGESEETPIDKSATNDDIHPNKLLNENQEQASNGFAELSLEALDGEEDISGTANFEIDDTVQSKEEERIAKELQQNEPVSPSSDSNLSDSAHEVRETLKSEEISLDSLDGEESEAFDFSLEGIEEETPDWLNQASDSIESAESNDVANSDERSDIITEPEFKTEQPIDVADSQSEQESNALDSGDNAELPIELNDEQEEFEIPMLEEAATGLEFNETKVEEPSVQLHRCWVIGASLGGPAAVKRFMQCLPADVNASFVIVQHIDENFLPVLAEILTSNSNFDVTVATGSNTLEPGKVYLAPLKGKLIFLKDGSMMVDHSQKWSQPYSPCIDDVMTEIAPVYKDRCGAIIFSGMGQDGLEGAKKMQAQNATVWAQTVETCANPSMPEAIINENLASIIASPESLAEQVSKFSN